MVSTNSVPEHYVNAYSANLTTQYFMHGGKLINIADDVHDGVVGEMDNFDLIQQVEAALKTTQYEEQPNLSPVASRRFLYMQDFYWNAYIDRQDQLKMLIDPQSAYTLNALEALRRFGDNLIYQALLGSVWQGRQSPTLVALPSTQQVAAGTGPASVDKVMDAAAILNKNNVPMDNRYLIVNWAFLDDMLREQEIGSADYNNVKSLMTGTIESWMGFRWILYNYAAASANTYNAVAVHPASIGLSRAASLNVKVDVLPTKHYLTQVYASMSMNALRKQDAGVVQITHTHA